MFKKNEHKGMKACHFCNHFYQPEELVFKGRYGKVCPYCLWRVEE